jgi:hypothetical protein
LRLVPHARTVYRAAGWSAGDRLETTLRESCPNACCFTCLATRLDVLVQQLRDVAVSRGKGSSRIRV